MAGTQDLLVWQRSMALVEVIYKISAKFPRDEIYNLTSQVRRCAISIPSNIAEGEGRHSRNDFARFLQIANGSLMELRTQLLIAERLGFVNRNSIDLALKQIDEIGRMLHGLVKVCKSADS